MTKIFEHYYNFWQDEKNPRGVWYEIMPAFNTESVYISTVLACTNIGVVLNQLSCINLLIRSGKLSWTLTHWALQRGNLGCTRATLSMMSARSVDFFCMERFNRADKIDSFL